MMEITCAWDWQAVAAFAQALAIIGAALLARATVSHYFASKSSERSFHVADESYQIAAMLAHRLRILRLSQTPKLALEHDIEAFDRTEKLHLFEENVVAPLQELLPQARRLYELGIAGDLFIGAEFELCCRRISTCYEAAAHAAANVKTRLELAKKKAALGNNAIPPELDDALQHMKDQLAIIDGDSDRPHGQMRVVEDNLEQLKRITHALVRGKRVKAAPAIG